MADRIVTIGIIGYGVSTLYFHLPLLMAHPRYRVIGVVSTRSDITLSAGIVQFRTTAELLAHKPEVVVVATPTPSHFAVTETVLNAGVHAVVEKPFVASPGEGEELIAIAKKMGVLLTVFHNRRWDNGILTIKGLITRGDVGIPRLYMARFDRYRPVVNAARWRESAVPGSGLLNDIGSHLIDQALWLFGAPIKTQGTTLTQRKGASTDDYFSIELTYPELQVRLAASCFVQGTYPHLELHGDGGSFMKYGLDPQEGQARARITPRDAAWGIEDSSMHGTLTSIDARTGQSAVRKIASERGSYSQYYDMLWGACTKGEMLPVTADEGLAVIKTIESIRRGIQ